MGWRLPESASACLIPCLSLCLACVERKRMVRRTVLPSRACAAALFSPSATRGGAAAPLHTERRRPASRSLSGIAPSKQESTTYEPSLVCKLVILGCRLLIPDRLLARLFHQSKFQRHFGSGNRLRRSVGGAGAAEAEATGFRRRGMRFPGFGTSWSGGIRRTVGSRDPDTEPRNA